MAVHKLLIDEFISIDYGLIAIHSSLEDFRLAYFINRELSILLERCATDINYTFPGGECRFSRFVYEDSNETVWDFIQNRNTVSTKQEGESLFGREGISVSTNVYLLPELKKTDYLLKVENLPDRSDVQDVADILLGVKHVTTAYTIDHNKLKSKNNLIF